jgi:hypothetical protein
VNMTLGTGKSKSGDEKLGCGCGWMGAVHWMVVLY